VPKRTDGPTARQRARSRRWLRGRVSRDSYSSLKLTNVLDLAGFAMVAQAMIDHGDFW
jgi:hypothetical protein